MASSFKRPWVEKYRPANIGEIIHQNSVKQFLSNYMHHNEANDIPHLLFYGSAGTGKCLAPHTRVIMYDGTTRQVKDVIKGDLLMGDDSTPRTVLSTCTGKDVMYRIEQSHNYEYTVNSEHILTLKSNKTFEVRDITIKDFIAMSIDEKMEWKGFRVAVDFPPNGIAFNASEVIRVLEQEKRIPSQFLTMSRQDRFALLDLLGKLSDDGSGNKCVIRVCHHEQLLMDVCYLLRSLGMVIQSTKTDQSTSSFVIRYSIPKHEKELMSQLFVIRMDRSDYCGFELDGNGRFLLADFTVTHNTSTALAMAKEWFANVSDKKERVLELNASSERGIDVIREKIQSFAAMSINTHEDAPQFKFVILDEADSMTIDAQAALRRVMEERSKDTRFCLICNYKSHIISPILSRCTSFNFSPIPEKDAVDFLMTIVQAEKIGGVGKDWLRNLIGQTGGDLRQAIHLLQTVHQTQLKPTIDLIGELTCRVPKQFVDQYFDVCATKNSFKIMEWVKLFVNHQFSTKRFLQQLTREIYYREEWDDETRARFCIKATETQSNIEMGGNIVIQLVCLSNEFMK
jgi:replication factor C subunit 2/4